MKKLIAKTRIGAEFLHSKNDSFFCSKNAQRIAEILNENRYNLTDGEKWHVYDYDFSHDMYVFERIYIDNKGRIKAARIA